MTEAVLSAATRRRALMTWVVSILRFHVEAGDRDGQHRMCRILRGLELAGDPEVLVQTARLADLLRQETVMLRVVGTA